MDKPANIETADDLEGIFGGVRFSNWEGAGAARAEAAKVRGRMRVEKCMVGEKL